MVLGSGKIFYDRPLFHKNLPSDAVVYVYKPDDPTCRKEQSTAAVAQAAPEPKKPAPPEEVVEGKKDEKPKAQPSPKAASKTVSAEAQEIEARRQRARQTGDATEPPSAVPGAEIAKKKRETAALLRTVRPWRKATSMTTSACPTCISKQAPAIGRSLCGAAKVAARGPAGPAESPKAAAVRKPILDALLAFEGAKSGADKETHRRRLQVLFESVSPSLAQAFQGMLGTGDALGVTFQRALANDPLRKELLDVLTKKYVCPPPAPAPAPEPPAAPQGTPLPAVALTDQAAFSALHTSISDWIKSFEEALSRAPSSATVLEVTHLLKESLPALRWHLNRVQETTKNAFQQADPAKKALGIKTAGERSTALLYATKVVELDVNIAVTTAWADDLGVAWGDLLKAAGKWRKEDVVYAADPAIQALTQAALDVNLPKIAAALPAATVRYEHYCKSLDDFIALTQKGAVLSKKVVQAANVVMIAISIYQVARTPVIASGGTPKPPTILGTLPGGVALGSTVSLASVASALAALQKLVAIGALDGALIGGVGRLGGGPGLALPELQRPTSLSVQQPNQPSSSPGNSTPQTTSGTSSSVSTGVTRMNPRDLVGRQGALEMTKGRIARMAQAMKDGKFDWNAAGPIRVAERNGTRIIIDGHHRAAAALRAGLREVPVRVEQVTDEVWGRLSVEAAEAAGR